MDNRGYINGASLAYYPKGLPCLSFSSKFFLFMEYTPLQTESQISIGHPSTTTHCEIRIPPYITKSCQKNVSQTELTCRQFVVPIPRAEFVGAFKVPPSFRRLPRTWIGFGYDSFLGLQVNSNPKTCYCECFTNTLIPISSHFMLLGTTRFLLVAFSNFHSLPLLLKIAWKIILPEFCQLFLSPKIR